MLIPLVADRGRGRAGGIHLLFDDAVQLSGGLAGHDVFGDLVQDAGGQGSGLVHAGEVHLLIDPA